MTSIVLFGLGVLLLIGGAEVLVRGASRIALAFGISPLVVGLTVVAFGTSAPELAVSVQAAWGGQPDVAMGNIVGSNILNVLLILGLSALIVPLTVDRQLVRQEVPLMIGASALLTFLAFDGRIGRLDGLILFSMLIGYTIFVIRQSRAENHLAQRSGDTDKADAPASNAKPSSVAGTWPFQIGLIALGLVLLVFGATILVNAAIEIARYLGVSEVVIGLTVVALGTSLPEIATSLMAALRGARDIAVGNVVGSNLFNILCVAGASSMVSPEGLTVAASMMRFDLPFMLAVAVICLPIFFSGSLISRAEGACFALAYVAYTVYLILAAASHDALEAFSFVMLAFVVPIVVMRICFVALREWRS